MAVKATTVAEYLRALDPDRRKEFTAIRKLVKSELPGAREVLLYGMPHFVMGEPVCGLAAQKLPVSAGVDLLLVAIVLSGCAATRSAPGSDGALGDALCSGAAVAERVSGLEFVAGRGLSVPDPTESEELDGF